MAGSALLIDLFRKLEMDKIANKVLPSKRSFQGTESGPDDRDLYLT